jgi:hypothetical protein
MIEEKKYGSLREKIAAEKIERTERYAKFAAVYDEANRAGYAAGEAAKPRAMMVVEHSNPMDDNSQAKKMWHEPEGACGFAWVKIMPASCSFARGLKKAGHIRGAAYGGGCDIWISAHGQSIERKEAHARAMAKVLSEKLGIKAYANSRMD